MQVKIPVILLFVDYHSPFGPNNLYKMLISCCPFWSRSVCIFEIVYPRLDVNRSRWPIRLRLLSGFRRRRRPPLLQQPPLLITRSIKWPIRSKQSPTAPPPLQLSTTPCFIRSRQNRPSLSATATNSSNQCKPLAFNYFRFIDELMNFCLRSVLEWPGYY